MDIKSAEEILIDLVNEGVLSMIIAVECENEDHPHQFLFHSLDEYAVASSICPECSAPMNFSNVKVGFRRVYQ